MKRNFSNRIKLFPYNLWEILMEIEFKSVDKIPYRIWKWFGENLKVFGETFWERYEKMNSVKRLLEDTFLEVKKKNPKMFKDLDIDEE